MNTTTQGIDYEMNIVTLDKENHLSSAIVRYSDIRYCNGFYNGFFWGAFVTAMLIPSIRKYL